MSNTMSKKSMSRPLNEFDKNNTDGMWRLLHIIAEDAKDEEGMKCYKRVFHNLCKKFHGCDCENHCVKMLDENKIEDWFYTKKPNLRVDEKNIPVGCLDHSFHCHNLVNERLGKMTYSFEELRPLYRKDLEPCKMTNSNENDRTETFSNLLGSESSNNKIWGNDNENQVEKTFNMYDLYTRYPNLFEKTTSKTTTSSFDSKRSSHSPKKNKKSKKSSRYTGKQNEQIKW